MNFAACTTRKKRSNITIGEAGTKYTLLNPTLVEDEYIQVDGCLITSQTTKKCDAILKVDLGPGDSRAAFFEFKGASCKVTEAIEQLDVTVKTTKRYFPSHKMAAYVVGGVFPQGSATKQQLISKFVSENEIRLFFKNRGGSQDLETLCIA